MRALACLVSSNIRDLCLLYASRKMLCALVEKSCAHARAQGLEGTLLRGALDTARIVCRSLKPKRHRQLRVKDLPKVPVRRLEPDSNPENDAPSNRSWIEENN